MEVYGEKPQKFTAKWWEYVWEYYKWHIICVLFAIFMLVTTLHQCATKPKYDLKITAVTEQELVMSQTDTLTEMAQGVISDATGNGEIEAFFMPIVMNDKSDPQMAQANYTKFTVEMSMPEAYVFIMSKKYVDMVEGSELFETTDIWAGGSADEELVSLEGNEKLAALGIDTKELYLGVARIAEGNKENELEKARYENGVLFARHLLGLE